MSSSPSDTQGSGPAYRPVPGRPALLLAFLCVAGFMTFLDVSIVNVALPTIESELGISRHQLPYVVTTYGMVLGGFLLLCGRLADYFGRRLMLQIGLVVFAVTSLLAGLAQDAVMLILARGLQGLGAAFMATAALSILTNAFAEGPERNRALGAWGALSGIAAIAGVILGGLFTDGPGWRWIFFINVPIGLIGAALAPILSPESRAKEVGRSFDTAGAILLTCGLLLLIYVLGQSVDGASKGWASFEVIGSFVVAILLLAAFLLNERSAKAPLVPLGVFRLRSLQTANVIAVLLLGTVVPLFFFTSLFMQQVLAYSPTFTGLAYLPLATSTAVSAGLASILITKMSIKPVLLVGLALAMSGLLLLWRAPAGGSYIVDILPAFMLIGAGLGLSFVPVQIAAFVGVEEKEFGGLAAGLINTSQEAGGALGLAIVASIVFRRLPELMEQAGENEMLVRLVRESVFHEAFLIGFGFLAVAFTVTLLRLPMLNAPAHDRRTA